MHIDRPLANAPQTKTNGSNQASNIEGVTERANAIFELPSTCQTILYHHALAGFPVKETFLNAVRAGDYATWPGLTIAVLHKYFPNSDKTQKGHMKGQQQGIGSTKQKALDHLVESEKLVKIKVEPGTEEVLPAKRHNDIFVRVNDLANSIHSDQTGAFPYTLQQGNHYVMIAIHLDANYIFYEPMKNRLEDEMIEAYQKIINRMEAARLGLKTHRLDIEASKVYKQWICQNGMMHELVPPDNHRSNLAERAIQTFKHHFISILRGVDDKFLLSLWCMLLEQTELTVNLLRQSNVVPKMSDFTHVHSQHDYMKKPFVPIGCAVQIHVKLGTQQKYHIMKTSTLVLVACAASFSQTYAFTTTTRAMSLSALSKHLLPPPPSLSLCLNMFSDGALNVEEEEDDERQTQIKQMAKAMGMLVEEYKLGMNARFQMEEAINNLRVIGGNVKFMGVTIERDRNMPPGTWSSR
jgi:hypothetical protein